jgi:ATP-dependent Clp protease ATP-binding subunit ClpA
MFERFAPDSKRAVAAALEIAKRLGAEHVEPEHLLLALAPAGGGAGGPTGRALAEAGLDAAAIEQAIEQDLVAALETVGVPPSVVASTPVLPRVDRPNFSAPAKQALEQALQHAVRRGERRLGGEHVLLGLIDPPAVSVGRVLARLDVEPQRLAELVQVEMAAGA